MQTLISPNTGEELVIDENYITPFNKLPIIIDEPGKYLMRNGAIVVIHEVKPTKTFCTTAFNAKGNILKKNGRIGAYNIWHISGKFSGSHHEHSMDIVQKL